MDFIIKNRKFDAIVYNEHGDPINSNGEVKYESIETRTVLLQVLEGIKKMALVPGKRKLVRKCFRALGEKGDVIRMDEQCFSFLFKAFQGTAFFDNDFIEDIENDFDKSYEAVERSRKVESKSEVDVLKETVKRLKTKEAEAVKALGLFKTKHHKIVSELEATINELSKKVNSVTPN